MHLPSNGGNNSQVFDYDCEAGGHGNPQVYYSVPDQRLYGQPDGVHSYNIGTTSSAPNQFVKLTTSTGSGTKWHFNNVYIRGWGGLCLDLAGGNTNNGVVQLWYCGALGGANQKWTITSGRQIRFGNTSKCLTAPASGSGQFYVTTCGTSSRQLFNFGDTSGTTLSGRITSDASGACLDAAGPLDSDSMNGSGIALNGTPYF